MMGERGEGEIPKDPNTQIPKDSRLKKRGVLGADVPSANNETLAHRKCLSSAAASDGRNAMHRVYLDHLTWRGSSCSLTPSTFRHFNSLTSKDAT